MSPPFRPCHLACCQGSNRPCAEGSLESHFSKQLEILNRMGVQSISIFFPNKGSHGCNHKWADLWSTRGSQVSISDLNLGRTTSATKASATSTRRTFLQVSIKRMQGSNSRGAQATKAFRKWGIKDASNKAEKRALSPKSCHLAMAFKPTSGALKGCQMDNSRFAVGRAKAKATSVACKRWNSLGRERSLETKCPTAPASKVAFGKLML